MVDKNARVRTSLTISDTLWREVQRRAEAQGVSASQFIREATAMRVGWEAAKEGDRDMTRARALIRQ